MKKKKICIIAAAPSGIINFHKTNIQELAKSFDVYIISNFEDKTMFSSLDIVDAFPVRIERRPSIKDDLRALKELYKVFKRERFDAFLSMSANASLLSAIAGRMAKIPIRIRIFTGQILVYMTGMKRKFFRVVDKITVALNTHLLTDGKPQREFLEEQGILKKGQAEVLANGSICGVDTELFKPNKSARASERAKLGLKEDDVAFTFMGRVNRDKGTFEMLAATNELAKTYNNLKLVLIGNMEGLTEDVIKQYPNLVIGKNVLLYGYTSKPYETLSLADVFLLPSYREGFGMSAIEAASIGLPVICSDAYGLRDSYVDGVTGLTCKVKDVPTLVDAMKKMHNDKQMREQMGKAGRERIVEKFDKSLVSQAWHEYFKKILS